VLENIFRVLENIFRVLKNIFRVLKNIFRVLEICFRWQSLQLCGTVISKLIDAFIAKKKNTAVGVVIF